MEHDYDSKAKVRRLQRIKTHSELKIKIKKTDETKEV